MKKNLLFIAALMLVFVVNGYCQAIMKTGTMDVNLSKYGRIRLLTTDQTIQLDRSSILVGKAESAVFDYQNDAVELSAPTTVATPSMSDFEITGSINGGSATTPPDVTVKLNAYGWTNQSFTIVKYTITNNEASEFNATIGLDIIPSIAEEYLDTISYNSTAKVVRFHYGATRQNIGIKLLSATMTSVNSFVWYDAYEVDATYWNWMKKGTLEPMFPSTLDPEEGTVTITGQDPVSISPGASVDVYYAYALGADEQTMLSNIAAAELKYAAFTTSLSERQPSANGLKNYPNPVKNATKISYELPSDGFVSLKIYDAIGNVAATLVNAKQSGGLHTIDFNTKDLPRGVYSYSLMYNNQVKTSKMVIVK